MTIKGKYSLEEALGKVEAAVKLLDEAVRQAGDSERDKLYQMTDRTYQLAASIAQAIPLTVKGGRL